MPFKTHRASLLILSLSFFSVGAVAQVMTPREAETRARALVRQMTINEKIDLLSGGSMMGTKALPRLNIPEFRMSDGPVGAHVPAPSTALAAGIGLAASWDIGLAETTGRQLGRDSRSRGVHYLLGPGVNIYRTPLNGRNFEYFGEDPFLASRIAVGYVQGVQEEGVSATIKHYMGNNSEYARFTEDSHISERAMREIYLPVFEAAVKDAHVGAVMNSYNLTNGQHMTENGYLNNEVLRKQWGFTGLIMSDWTAVHDGIAATNNGTDLEMPFGSYMNRATLLSALREGSVKESMIDFHVERLLALAFRFGWMNKSQIDLTISRFDPEGRKTALKGAQEGMVLLKNTGVLPVDTERVKTILVVGPDAFPAIPTAGGSGYVQPFHSASVLEGISERFGSSATVTYAHGVKNINQLTFGAPFMTAEAGGKKGVLVETFEGVSASGKLLSTRTEASMTTGKSFSADPESSVDYSSWTAEDLASVMGGTALPTSSRWTGYITPSKSGEYYAYVESMGKFRMLIDGRVVIDNSVIAKAALNQTVVNLSSGAHKVVVELLGGAQFGGDMLRAGVVAKDAVVEQFAKDLARKADLVIVAAGFASDNETEGADRMFQLPVGQDELIQELAAINKNTIVTIISGGSVDVTPWYDAVAGLIELWYPGQEGGRALGQLLAGDISPSGHLPISWEKHLEDNPSIKHYYFTDPKTQQVDYKDDIFVGYRGYDHEQVNPLFPFGYGLSYTTFRLSNLAVRKGADGVGFVVTVDVMNSGTRIGADVVQLYLADPQSRVERPKKELKGFQRVELAPGETKTVQIDLNQRAFTYFDTAAKGWHADAGKKQVLVGHSERDIDLEGEIVLESSIDLPSDSQ